MAFLVVLDRVPPHFRLYARRGNAGNGAAHLHLRAGTRMGSLEHDRDCRSFVPGRGAAVLPVQSGLVVLSGSAGGQRSMGRVDLGMVDLVSATRIQLCSHSGSEEPAATLGYQALGRSGLEV